MKSNCCGADIIEDTDVCSKCQEHCEAIIEITARVKKGAPVKFRQAWLGFKNDELECNVYTLIGGTELIIEINHQSFSIDISELAGELVEKVVS